MSVRLEADPTYDRALVRLKADPTNGAACSGTGQPVPGRRWLGDRPTRAGFSARCRRSIVGIIDTIDVAAGDW